MGGVLLEAKNNTSDIGWVLTENNPKPPTLNPDPKTLSHRGWVLREYSPRP